MEENETLEPVHIGINISDLELLQFARMHLVKDGEGCCYSEKITVKVPQEFEPVSFLCPNLQKPYEVFDLIDWGGWNDSPAGSEMKAKAEKWEEHYGLRLTALSQPPWSLLSARLFFAGRLRRC